MTYPREIKRIIFRPSIIAFGDVLEFIGENKAADVFKVIHENDHFVSVTRRKDNKSILVPIHSVNNLEYTTIEPEPAKEIKRPSPKSKTNSKLV